MEQRQSSKGFIKKIGNAFRDVLDIGGLFVNEIKNQVFETQHTMDEDLSMNLELNNSLFFEDGSVELM